MVPLYRRLRPTSLGLTMPCLTQAPHLGGLPRTSRLPLRDSYFTPVEPPTGAPSQRVVAHLIWAAGVSLHSNLAPRGAPTMAAPTPMRFTGERHPSPHGPPTFILTRSTRWFWQRLCPTNPTLRGILNGYGFRQVAHIILWAGFSITPASVAIWLVHWPVRQGLSQGVDFP